MDDVARHNALLCECLELCSAHFQRELKDTPEGDFLKRALLEKFVEMCTKAVKPPVRSAQPHLNDCTSRRGDQCDCDDGGTGVVTPMRKRDELDEARGKIRRLCVQRGDRVCNHLDVSG